MSVTGCGVQHIRVWAWWKAAAVLVGAASKASAIAVADIYKDGKPNRQRSHVTKPWLGYCSCEDRGHLHTGGERVGCSMVGGV